MHQLKTFRTNSPNSLKAPAREMTDLKKQTTKNKKLHHTKLSSFQKRAAREGATDALYLDL